MIGIPPKYWMIHNPLKVYEFTELIKKINFESTDIVLDFGCGTGIWTPLIAENCKKVIGVDISSKAIISAKQLIRNSQIKKNKIHYINNQLETINFPKNTFDHVVSICVLEHLSNLNETLLEIRRILKPGGYLHITVDSLEIIDDLKVKKKHEMDHHVVRYFTPKTIRNVLEKSGYLVEKVKPILKGPFGENEFFKRIINNSYQINLLNRIKYLKLFKKEDLSLNSNKGILIVCNAKVEKSNY